MDVDVLVVGAGPTGLMMAGELLRRGVRTRIVDKLDAPSPHSKAIGVHARTLEIFDDLGIAGELVSRGVAVEGVTMRAGDEPVITVDFAGLDTRFPFILCLSQQETESVLAALLEKRGGKVERSVELVSLGEDEAVLRTPSGEERVRARWVVGCDGAHSAVRRAVNAPFEGHTYEETFLLADVRVDWDLPSSRVWTFFAEDGVVAFFPLRGGRFRVIVTAAESLGDKPTLDDVRRVVDARVGKHVAMDDAIWLAPFRIHCRQVAQYRHGNAFLAGDAAHIHSPIGGQGMNTGIQDAHNLAWKLALVVKGKAKDELLDSYSLERHAIGKNVLRQTDLATQIGTLKGAWVPIRNQLAKFVTSFEPVRMRAARDAAELTVGYAGSPIVGENTSSMIAARFGKPEAAETPTIGSRMAFSGGPKPGMRSPPLAEVRGDAFTLLLFDGRSASAAGYASLVAIARRVRAQFGDLVVTHLVTPRADRPSEVPEDVAVVHDVDGDLEKRWGATTECLYLIRPDLYVGFRAQPANGDALVAHLSTLVPGGAISHA
jgi:2-polyprenyl-6-methoxyphenol hydroxylase-like FAD-dependent oxidoreductase